MTPHQWKYIDLSDHLPEFVKNYILEYTSQCADFENLYFCDRCKLIGSPSNRGSKESSNWYKDCDETLIRGIHGS